MYLNSFDYFRAISIFIIVIGHSYGISGWVPDTLSGNVLKTYLSGGTTLFVFISGYLFHHVFYSKFNFKKFMRSKFKNVLMPYLILSFVPIAYLSLTETIGIEGFVGSFIYYLLTGTFLTAYWYIPFIISIFLLSPLFIFYIKLSLMYKVIALLVLVAISMVIARPEGNVNVIQSIFYFSPAYLFGIICSIYSKALYSHKMIAVVAFVISFILAYLQVYTHGVGGNYHKDAFIYLGLDFMLLHKMALSVFLCTALNFNDKYELKWLKNIASASFSIFFLHPFVLFVWRKIFGDEFDSYGLINLLPFSILVFVISIGIAYIIKKILGKRSRQFIGW